MKNNRSFLNSYLNSGLSPTEAMEQFIQECYEADEPIYDLNYMHGVAVAGGHYGDEGKGKIVDIKIRQLKEKGYNVINVRGQGGGNAGHTVVDNITKKEYHFHYLPSGGLKSDLVLIGGGMLIDPEKLLNEIIELPEEQRVKVLVDGRATLCTLLERSMDSYYETCRDKSGTAKIGSTGSGIGPAVSYRALRVHIQFFKIKECKSYVELGKLFEQIPNVPEEVTSIIVDKYGSMDSYYMAIYNAVQKLTVVESMPIIQATKNMGWSVVLEVSQAACLDCIWGNEGNFVTSTHTTIPGAMADAGICPGDVTEGIIITKAYASKVGGGPFTTKFTEKDSAIAEYIYEHNGEKGVTTGRLRNLGYYDAIAVRMAIQRNGYDVLTVNCMDTIGLIPGGTAKICVAYRHKDSGMVTKFWPDRQSNYEPVYEDLPVGWNIKHETREENVPKDAWRYLAHIEHHTGGRVGYIGTGGSDADIIVVSEFGRAIMDKIKEEDFPWDYHE